MHNYLSQHYLCVYDLLLLDPFFLWNVSSVFDGICIQYTVVVVFVQYKNVRPDYLKNIWKVINWKFASEVYEKESP